MLTEQGGVHFTWRHEEPYLAEGSSRELHVLLYIDGADICTAISERPFAKLDIADRASLEAAARTAGVSTIMLSETLPLTPVHIEKPWGQEIWYSGIEARGISLINGTPISWVMDIYGTMLGCPDTPLLLKILDPYPTENLGDLYFEMHEQKIEVYVVTAINREAWPGGSGAIRYGFNQKKLAEFESREAFLKAYVDQVSKYQACRNDIDERLGDHKGYEDLLTTLPRALAEQEQELREQMYAFTELKPLKPGDVVTVRPLVPHSLQHGVRVVEFQTPHYERYILSFGQKVLTQDHWDTEEVFEKANTSAVAFEQPRELGPGQDLIADFDEFRVTRTQLEPGGSFELDADGYRMLMGVQGNIVMSGKTVKAEAAFLIPKKMRVTLTNPSASPAIFLIAVEVSAKPT